MIYEIGSGKMIPLSADGKNDLEIGRVLHLNGYNEPDYVITGKMGMGNWGGGMNYKYISLEDFHEAGTEAVTLKFLSEKQDNRIQLYITDEIKTADEVLDLIEKAQAAKLVRSAEAQKKKDAKEAGLKMLPSMYPYLEPQAGSRKSGHALGASNLRKELKRAFPNTKFSVSSNSYSGGCSIDIHWTDGVTTDDVEKISNKYQYADFDGMTDSTTYRDEIFTDVFGGAKYVMEQRSVSDAAFNAQAVKMGYPEAVFNSQTGQFDGVSYETNEMIKREAWKKEF